MTGNNKTITRLMTLFEVINVYLARDVDVTSVIKYMCLLIFGILLRNYCFYKQTLYVDHFT